MSYTAVIAPLVRVKEHSNADKLKLATVTGEQVVVGLDAKDGDLGIFFPIDGQLTTEFMYIMNLHRHADLNTDKTQTGMFDNNGRVRAQTFRGEKSEGFWLPLSNLPSDLIMDNVAEGYEFTFIGAMEVCRKYISPKTRQMQGSGNGETSKKITNTMFHEHFDTGQYGRNEHQIGLDEVVIITEKLHGTSQRVGNVKVTTSEPLSFWNKLCGFLADGHWLKAIEVGEWKHLIGTRRVILGKNKDKDANGFHPVSFREQAAEPFMNNLRKGETVYYEVVGYECSEHPIMGSHSNSKLKSFLSKEEYKKTIETFGDNTVFSYGTTEGEFGIYVYRITYTNEDGFSVDLSWDAVKERCDELGVRYTPELYRGTRKEMAQHMANILDDVDGRENMSDELVRNLSNEFVKQIAGGKTTIGNNLREGVCTRVERGTKPLVLKEKNFIFKVLEGIIKDSNEADAEEMEG